MLYAVDSFQQEGGEPYEFNHIFYPIYYSKCNCLLHMQVAGWIV